MTKSLWINLPVKDVNKSRDFFTSIGFSLNADYGNTDSSASLLVGENNLVVMLFTEEIFKSFTGSDILDTKQGATTLFSFDTETREEVDQLAQKVAQAGGTVTAGPKEDQGWMYGFGFSDLDGHRWNVLHMDMSKLPAQ